MGVRRKNTIDKGTGTSPVWTVFWLCGLLLCQAPEAGADIYFSVDKNGVLHFTNAPASRDYKLYMRDESSRSTASVHFGANHYDRYIQEASWRNGLDFALIKAVIKVESDFNPRAVSRAGAKGLMQLMPQTHTILGVSNPFDPRENILGGARYLKYLLERFNGSLAMALAAYNAGPTVVERHNSIPPIYETETYVRKVLRQYRAYLKSS